MNPSAMIAHFLRFARRSAVPLTAIALVAAVIVAVKVREHVSLRRVGRSATESVVVELQLNEPSPARTMIYHIKLDGKVKEVYNSAQYHVTTCILPNGSMYVAEIHPQPDQDPTFRYIYPVLHGIPHEHGWGEQLATQKGYVPCPILSPDGKLMAIMRGTSAPEDRCPVLITNRTDGTSKTIRLPGEWVPTGAQWSPDASKIAFYCARRQTYGVDLDDEVATLALAVTDMGGNFRVLADRSSTSQYTRPSIPKMRPFWSPDGRCVYFVGGPPADREHPTFWWKPCASTYKCDLQSGEIVFMSFGAVRWMAPNGTSMLLHCCPSDQLAESSGQIRRASQTWRIDLPSMHRTVVPEDVGTPLPSPSGEYAVSVEDWWQDLHVGWMRFYRTSDWKVLGRVHLGKLMRDRPIQRLEIRWIAPGASESPSAGEPTTRKAPGTRPGVSMRSGALENLGKRGGDPRGIDWAAIVTGSWDQGKTAETWAGEARGMFRVETVRQYFQWSSFPGPWWVEVFQDFVDYEP